MILLFYHLEILPEILSIFFVSCVAFAIFLWQFCHLMNYMSKPMCQIKVWWKYCINLLKTIWQSFKFRKHCWHLWLKNIAEECWTFFSSWQFFWQKNITLSLCHQIAELKLPMCGQGLKLMPDLTKKNFFTKYFAEIGRQNFNVSSPQRSKSPIQPNPFTSPVYIWVRWA